MLGLGVLQSQATQKEKAQNPYIPNDLKERDNNIFFSSQCLPEMLIFETVLNIWIKFPKVFCCGLIIWDTLQIKGIKRVCSFTCREGSTSLTSDKIVLITASFSDLNKASS